MIEKLIFIFLIALIIFTLINTINSRKSFYRDQTDIDLIEKNIKEDIINQAKSLKKSGEITKAVRLIRRETGMSLKEAKSYIDSL
ncbi:MAG: hypothetical protein ACTHWZ_07035 [Peptoniphilaceae bacterium]